MNYDLVVVGGGPAGLAAAVSAYENGVSSILIIERDRELGGILNQCIHNGFGLHYFNEELTGPEYASKFIKMLENTNIKVMLNTMVIDITSEKIITATNSVDGYFKITAKAIILAMGCRERTRGQIMLPGTRPSGVLTAGSAQYLVNISGESIGKKVVILGSGDIGLIMARRMSLEGAKVLACLEIMPFSSGLNRNIVQCLNDYDIPLYLSHTITFIHGKNRVEGVSVSKVDENRQPIADSEFYIECDTVLLSCGLIPENELSKACGVMLDKKTNGAVVSDDMSTSIHGIFACGNVLHVHDLVDFVTNESKNAGYYAACYIQNKANKNDNIITVNIGNDIGYTVPQKINANLEKDKYDIFFRVRKVFSKSIIYVMDGDKIVAKYKREHAIPAEMEKISIPKKLMENVKALTISIESVE